MLQTASYAHRIIGYLVTVRLLVRVRVVQKLDSIFILKYLGAHCADDFHLFRLIILGLKLLLILQFELFDGAIAEATTDVVVACNHLLR